MFQVAVVIFWIISGPASVCAAQADSAPLSAHGTINVVLANRNGMVVVTDSNLTDPQGKLYRYEAPKLFRLDDETVCTIAGYYFEMGPATGANSYPVLELVSKTIENYAKFQHDPKGTIKEKAENAAQVLQYALNLTENALLAQRKAGDPYPNPSPLVLTVAGYENGQSKVVQVALTPKIERGSIEYLRGVQDAIGPCENSFTIVNSFACGLAGLPKVAANILNGKDTGSLSDPRVAKYLEAKRSGQLGGLDLNELIALAKYLKEKTADYYNNVEVGGQTEVAIFSEGKLNFIQRVRDLPLPNPVRFIQIYNEQMVGYMPKSGASIPTQGALQTSPKDGLFVTRVNLEDVVQPLDNAIFTHTTFKDCYLTYAGSAMTVFDESNVIQNCKLFVLPTVDGASPILALFQRSFPDVEIVRGPIPIPEFWLFGQGPVAHP